MADARTSRDEKNLQTTNQERSNQRGGQLTRPERNRDVMTPFGFMRRFSDDMDRLFDDFARNPFGLALGEGRGLLPGMETMQGGAWAPRIEMFQRDSDLIVRADLPGLTKDDVQVEINGDELMLRGERGQEREEKRGGVYHSERSYGTFYRSIPLPEGVIPESAKATFINGVLEITIQAPPSHANKGHRVEIQETKNK